MPIFAVLSTIVLALILLSFLVLIHEFGHFFAAKWAGVHVEEFGLGYPPRVRTLFTWWNTEFSVNTIPIGGFVRLYGDDAELIEGKLESDGQHPSSSAFVNKTVLQRLVIILAGVCVNFLFGIAAFSAIYSRIGVPTLIDGAAVGFVVPGAPAAQAGFVENDLLLQIGTQEPLTDVRNIDHFVEVINANKGQTLQVRVRRQEKEQTLSVYARRDDERVEGEGAIGISLTDRPLQFFPWYQMPFRGAVAGVQDTWFLAKMMVTQLREMVVNLVVKQEVPQELSGPIGIIDQTYESRILTQGWIGRLRWMAVLSISLAVMNLLPIPVLDGGRAIFVLLEPVLGRARRLRWEQKANAFGFLFLMGLIVLISAKDIFMIFVSR